MTLFCESGEDRLTLTGVPIGMAKNPDGSGVLVLNFLTVSTTGGQALHAEHEGRVSLPQNLYEEVGRIQYDPSSRLSFTLEKAVLPEALREVADALAGGEGNFYVPTAAKVEPNPLAAFR